MGPRSWSRAVIKSRGPLVAVAGGGRVQVLACRDQCGGRGFWQGSWAVAVVGGLRLGTCSRVEFRGSARMSLSGGVIVGSGHGLRWGMGLWTRVEAWDVCLGGGCEGRGTRALSAAPCLSPLHGRVSCPPKLPSGPRAQRWGAVEFTVSGMFRVRVRSQCSYNS